ncbi:MAG: hypothetical protein M3033_08375 [Acidobacteriota bacterium]|nr:hypothetical protein [Acidobacteriota bacterium]
MKITNFIKLPLCGALIFLSAAASYSQKRETAKTAAPKPIVFAVLNDGQTIEPIAQIEKGKLVEPVNGGDEPKQLASFVRTFYKPNTKYSLIFGGKLSGTVTVKTSDPNSDCGKNLATVSVQSAKAKLKGFVMGLATDARTQPTALGVRRLPTYSERLAIESLVRAEFAKQGVAAGALKDLHYYNLTAIDVDNDGKAEMVGTFWVESSAKERNLLFFIADLGSDDKYSFGYSDYKKITPAEVMSGEIKDLDELGGELLLDVIDYDGDRTAEIFTIDKAFEGNNFHVYSRRDGKWSKVFEGYNYHCAY